MAKANSAARQARSSLRKNLQNHSIKNRIRTGLRQLDEMLKTEPQKAKDHGRDVVSWLDRATKSRVLHCNTARRHKARVMAKLRAIAK